MPKKKNNAEEKKEEVKTIPATTATTPTNEFVRCPAQKADWKGGGFSRSAMSNDR
jgi:hypothetical protein